MTADAVAVRGALTKPGVCGDDPEKSKQIWSSFTVTVSFISMVEPSVTPSKNALLVAR